MPNCAAKDPAAGTKDHRRSKRTTPLPGNARVPSMRVGWGAAVLALACGLLAGRMASATSDRPDAEDIIRRWADGPVRYLLTTKEDETVRELTAIPDLARFITQFWKRRDPTPHTLVNEYRLVFWDRVRTANLRFRDSAEPGWKSDRGKIFILMGEPNEVETDDVRVAIPDTLTGTNTGERPRNEGEATLAEAGSHEVIRWHYMRKRSQIANPEIIVAFVRDETGGWRLSTDSRFISADYSTATTNPTLDTSFGHPEARVDAERERALDLMIADQMSQALAARDRAWKDGQNSPNPNAGLLDASRRLDDLRSMRDGAESLLARNQAEMIAAAQAPGIDSGLFANYDLGLEMSAPSITEMAVAEVSARDFLSAFTPEPRFEFFRARDGSTFVNIGARVRESDVSGKGDLRLYARVSSPSDPKNTRFASNESEAGAARSLAAAHGGPIEAWTGLPLQPGRYDVTLALEDTSSGHVGRGEASIEVPDLSGPGPRLSTPILATELATVNDKLVVTARSSGTFRRSETFALYYEVYGLEEGAHFTAVYRFFREASGSWVPLGRPLEQPHRREGAQGWSFPLEKWPPGRFRIEVRVRLADGGAPKEAAASVEFVVTD